jgi:hypothetical protein
MLLPINAEAQDTGSGLDFLNIGPSAQILSMGEGTTAYPTGSSSIYSNPSLLSFEEKSGMDINYTLWISNLTTQFAAVHIKRNQLTYGFGIYGTRADDFEARSQPGPSSGLFSVSYLSLSTAVAYQVGPFSAGVTAQYLREEIFQLRANGYAFNVGTTLRFFKEKVLAGVSLNNLGEMEKLETTATPLPTMLNAGISAKLIEFMTPGNNDFPLLIGILTDWGVPLDDHYRGDFTSEDVQDSYTTFGLTVDAAELFEFQTAYRLGPTERPLSFGMGLSIQPVQFNYSFIPFSTGYGTAHSFGLQYSFN